VINLFKTKNPAVLLIFLIIVQILSPGISAAADYGGHATDPMYGDQWALKYEQLETYKAWETVGAELNGSLPESVVVAILDTGVDAGHEDLAGRVLPGQNFLTGAPDPTDTSDSQGHGTAVAYYCCRHQ